jgi:hypothetical protein
MSSYAASADPARPGGTGTRYFSVDTRGTIFVSNTAPIGLTIPAGAIAAQ